MGNLNKITDQASRSEYQEFTDVIVATRDLLTALGLDENPCDPDRLLDALNDQVTQFGMYAQDTFDMILANAGGGFILMAVKTISDLLEGTIFAWSDQVLEEFIGGKIIGTVISTAATALSVIPGAEMYFQYLAAKALKESLLKRSSVISRLQTDMLSLINLIQEYKDLFEYNSENQFAEIRNAIRRIEKAELYLGIEAGRALNTGPYARKVAQTDNLEMAKYYIDDAINILTSGNFKTAYLRVGEICKKYNLTSTPPSNTVNALPDISGWYKFFEKLNNEIVENYFTYSYKPGDSRYDKERTQKLNRYKSFVLEISPHVPKIFNIIMMQHAFNKISNRILELFPIVISRLSPMSSLKNVMDEAMEKAVDKIATGFTTSVETNIPKVTPANPNLSLTNTEIKMKETIIMLAPTTWKMVQSASSIYSGLIISSLKDLKDVKEDMKSVISEAPSKWEVWLDQVRWTSELEIIKAKIKPIISEYAGKYDAATGQTINGVKLAAWIEEAGLVMDDLKQFIYEKSFDEKTEKPRREPAEQAYTIAQKALIPLLTNITFLLSPMASTRMLQQLQAIKILLDMQRKLDYQEQLLTTNFIDVVEQHPYFPVIDKIMKDLLGSLFESPASEIVEAMANGDLTTLATYFEAGAAATDIAAMFLCTENDYTKYLDVDTLVQTIGSHPTDTFTSERIKKINTEVEESLQTLRNQKLQLERSFERAHKVIEGTKKTTQPTSYSDVGELDMEDILRQ